MGKKAKELNLFVLVPQFSETSFPGVYSLIMGMFLQKIINLFHLINIYFQ